MRYISDDRDRRIAVVSDTSIALMRCASLAVLVTVPVARHIPVLLGSLALRNYRVTSCLANRRRGTSEVREKEQLVIEGNLLLFCIPSDKILFTAELSSPERSVGLLSAYLL